MPKGRTETDFEAALREHTELREVMDDLQHFLEKPRPEIGQKGFHTWASEMSRRLVGLHDRLFQHFNDEEESGMLDELEERHPRAYEKIQALRGEHGEILAGIRDLMSATLSYSEGKKPPDPRLRQRLARILDKTSDHEQTETSLIQELLYDDLGESG